MWDPIVPVPDHCLSFYFVYYKYLYVFSPQPNHARLQLYRMPTLTLALCSPTSLTKLSLYHAKVGIG